MPAPPRAELGRVVLTAIAVDGSAIDDDSPSKMYLPNGESAVIVTPVPFIDWPADAMYFDEARIAFIAGALPLIAFSAVSLPCIAIKAVELAATAAMAVSLAATTAMAFELAATTAMAFELAATTAHVVVFAISAAGPM